MATCPICNDCKRMTSHGLKIHMGKVHGVHSSERVGDYVENCHMTSAGRRSNPVPSIEPEIESNERQQLPALVSCGHPFCKVQLPQQELRAHWDAMHDTWRMHSGRYVWEAAA